MYRSYPKTIFHAEETKGSDIPAKAEIQSETTESYKINGFPLSGPSKNVLSRRKCLTMGGVHANEVWV